jgi:hypothetical protein
MTVPCDQKETIESLKSSLADIRVNQALIGGDVSHIKSRLDNGMSHTIAHMNTMLTKLTPIIDHHADIVKRIEGIGWTLATTLIICLIAYLAYGVAHGFKLPI